MDKNTSMAFILIAVILMIWLYLNSNSTPTQQPQQQNQEQQANQQQQPAQNPQAQKQTAAPKEDNKEIKDSTYISPASSPEKIVTIETDLAIIEMTSKGGQIRKCYLKNYETWYHSDFDEKTDFYNTHIQLINQTDPGNLSIVFVTKDGKDVNTSDMNFASDNTSYKYKLTGNDSLSIKYTFTTKNNKKISKVYTFKGNDYASRFDLLLENMDDVITYRYEVHWANGINYVEANSKDESAYSSATVYSGEGKTTFHASSDKPELKTYNGKIDWVGIKDKYFAVIIAPLNQTMEGAALTGNQVKVGQDGLKEYYNANFKVPFSGEKIHRNSYFLYLGPVDYTLLKSYHKHLESIFQFNNFLGLGFIITPISEYLFLPFLKFLHSFIFNYGLVIILFTLVIKILLHPLTKQSLKSMKKMQLLQPMINELKEKYKDDSARVQKEQMKLYSTYGISPAGGCLPTLLQMPILISLYTVFNVVIDIRHAPFMLWINNLSAPDVILRWDYPLPLINNSLSGLALLMCITMFIQQKMTIKDPSQKMMVYMMPVLMFIMFNALPSGLNLYYLMFNLFSIAQQWYVMHRSDDIKLVPVENPKKKGGFMQRMMEAAEKQQEVQKKNQKRK